MNKLLLRNLTVKNLPFLFTAICLLSGACKGLQKETIVYQNDFEKGSSIGITNGRIEEFNGSKVLGRYSESGFVLQFSDLKPHDMIQISFDLNIHDSWDGNSLKPEGPDIWIMNIDGWSAIYSTFSNSGCTDCFQSYPVLQPVIENNQPVFFNNKINSNAIKTDLPGACKLRDIKGGTSMYKIVRTLAHTGNTLEIGCFAQLEDPDKANKNCNESWSVDNIRIKAIEFR